MGSGEARRVAVALSGGVDSAAAAALLVRQGYDVLGLTMLLPSQDEPGTGAVAYARSVADTLGIQHAVLDVGQEFERLVVGPFVDAYLGGLTPNPCVSCNREVKFGVLLEEALNRGCERLATGHYARLESESESSLRVFQADDAGKDQSYVLWRLDQGILSRVLLPLGHLSKQEAADAAMEAGVLETAPESQDICFITGDSYAGLIEARAKEAFCPGPIVDAGGNILGTHKGLPFYTVGQRRGLGLGGPEPMYVLELRPADNTLVVGPPEALATTEFRAHGLNFVSGSPPASAFECLVKTRYKGPTLPALVEMLSKDDAVVRYEEPGPPAAPGQSSVFYSDEELLGGGVISRPAEPGAH